MRSGRVVPLAEGRQRALLAVLLLHANEVVDSERLIEALWGLQPPKTARAALHGYVTQLRRLLPPDLLATRAGGYIVSVEPGELDLDRFEELVAAARTQAPADAATTLRAALSLWRGPALLDFRHEHFAQREVLRLEELRVAAIEQRIEADLALGRDDELVGELEALTAEHPFRERLAAQLMLALYRSGRQADALHAYQRARRGLIDELGIEPGSALRALEKKILTQDAELEAGRVQPAPIVEAAARGRAREDEVRPVTVLFADVVGSSALGTSFRTSQLGCCVRTSAARRASR